MDDDCSCRRRSSHALTMGQDLDIKRYDHGYVFDIWALFKTLATSCDSCYPGWPDNMALPRKVCENPDMCKGGIQFPQESKQAGKQASRKPGSEDRSADW